MNQLQNKKTIIPVFNDSHRIPKILENVIDFVNGNPSFYFEFADGGSTDGTVKILKEKISQNSNIGLHIKGNNKIEALKSSILNSTFKYVGFIDTNMSYSLSHLHTLFRKLKEFDLVIGNRELNLQKEKNSNFFYKYVNKFCNCLSRILAGISFKDPQAGLKSFRTQKAKKIFSKIHCNESWYNFEILFIAIKNNYSIGEVPAINADNSHSKANFIKFLKVLYGILMIHYYNFRGKY